MAYLIQKVPIKLLHHLPLEMHPFYHTDVQEFFKLAPPHHPLQQVDVRSMQWQMLLT